MKTDQTSQEKSKKDPHKMTESNKQEKTNSSDPREITDTESEFTVNDRLREHQKREWETTRSDT